MTPEGINQFFSFLYEGLLGEITFWLRIIAGVLVSAMAAAIIVIAVQFRKLIAGAAPSAPEAVGPSEIGGGARPWQAVMKNIDSSHPSDWNLAVIQGDAILDGVLKGMGLSGETMGERLKQLDRAKLASLDGLWEAHKIRNRIAHETDRTLAYEEARRAVLLFGESLRELGYLEQ